MKHVFEITVTARYLDEAESPPVWKTTGHSEKRSFEADQKNAGILSTLTDVATESIMLACGLKAGHVFEDPNAEVSKGNEWNAKGSYYPGSGKMETCPSSSRPKSPASA
jgi:hypothetical protein